MDQDVQTNPVDSPDEVPEEAKTDASATPADTEHDDADAPSSAEVSSPAPDAADSEQEVQDTEASGPIAYTSESEPADAGGGLFGDLGLSDAEPDEAPGAEAEASEVAETLTEEAPEETVTEAEAEAEAEAETDQDEELEEVLAPVISPYDRPGDWFVVHTYAGHENQVLNNLGSRIQSMNMEDRIYEVVIPMEDVIEFKAGKKQVVPKKVFPGYLMVRMDLQDEAWLCVRHTPGVTGFVSSGSKPIPLTRREVERILQVKPDKKIKPKLEWDVGQTVRVIGGPFADFNGNIDEINVDQSKLKVLVNIFGRETPVELGFDQVAKL